VGYLRLYEEGALMRDLHEKRVALAKDAINEVFSDTTVPKHVTRDSLETLRDEINDMLGVLHE